MFIGQCVALDVPVVWTIIVIVLLRVSAGTKWHLQFSASHKRR